MSKFQDFYKENQVEEEIVKGFSASNLLGLSNDLKEISNKLNLMSSKLNPIQVNLSQRQYLNQFIANCNNTANFLVNLAKIV